MLDQHCACLGIQTAKQLRPSQGLLQPWDASQQETTPTGLRARRVVVCSPGQKTHDKPMASSSNRYFVCSSKRENSTDKPGGIFSNRYFVCSRNVRTPRTSRGILGFHTRNRARVKALPPILVGKGQSGPESELSKKLRARPRCFL